MQFGTMVLSKDKGLRSDFQMINHRISHVMVIKPAKFIFERPDNSKMIIEIDGYLLEESPNQLFLLNRANVEYFKTLIENHYEEEKNEILIKVKELVSQKIIEQQKVEALQSSIQSLEEKNKMDFSANREKNIKQESKALRKYRNRVEAINKNIKEHEEKIIDYEKLKQYSIDIADKDMKKYL